ncbi:MAG: NADH-quinone oxidoreductase subunit F [Gammaproteobacteria bacterium]|nr:NADH-quinone oxidoreductase subunit F [Gammaproteobacteria bacterium]
MSAVIDVAMKRGHPGSGRKKMRPVLKGRQVEQSALVDVQALVGDAPLRRDLLIEYLHLVQDKYGYLSSAHIAALASLMRLAQTEVYEVATFYAHFDVVKEGETPPPQTTIRVCDSIACQLAGAEQLIGTLETSPSADIRVVRAPCMGRCDSAPVAEVGHNHIGNADASVLLDAANQGHIHPDTPSYITFNQYVESGGYQLLKRCLSGEVAPDSVIQSLDDSSLRGLGGAGFPTGRKWGIVHSFEGPRMMAVNADEGEPGTFKDRHYLETDPHRFIEGMLVAAWVVGTEKSYVYVRDEYPAIVSLLKTEIDAVRETGLADHVEIEVRRGAGAYICGEESAMIESIEGKRGLPRNRPPYVAEIGLFGRPTLENNVETLYWVRDIVEKGPEWFSQAGANGRKGWRSYSVSGRVNNPGVKLAPAGTTMNELIENYCGGMQDGHRFKAYLPGGASGGILPASLADEPLDFDTLQKHGCFIGSAAVVVFSHEDNMKSVALNLMEFFRDESCGQCTPCRVGTEKAVKVMVKPQWDVDLLNDLSAVMTDASICGLGQAAGNPINCVLKYFKEDL